MSLDTHAAGKNKPEYTTSKIEEISKHIHHIWPDSKIRDGGNSESWFWDYPFNRMNIVVGEAWKNGAGWRFRVRKPNNRIYPKEAT